MALPGSGQISFNDVMVEMSQSLIPSYYASTGYSTEYWVSGNYFYDGQPVHAPINLLSPGSRFSESSPLYFNNLSLSAWYDYNHSAYVGLNTTTSLYPHFAGFIGTTYASSMTVIDLGVSNATYNINISGSSSGNGGGGYWVIYYGKPWTNRGEYNATLFTGGVPYDSNGAIPVASGSLQYSYNTTISYDYTYDSNKGQYLYAVIYVENYAP
jgi:hypothetical protein